MRQMSNDPHHVEAWKKKLVQHNARGGDRTSQLWAKRIEEKAPPVLFYFFFSLNYCSVGSCELLAAGSASK